MSFNVKDKTVCLTGIVPNMDRTRAQAKLRAAGAHTVSTVTKNTHLLILGANVGPKKVEKAAALGVAVIEWDQVAWDGNGEEVAVSAAAPAPKPLAFVQIAPMLANPGEPKQIAAGDWAFEVKWDGYRAIAHIEDRKVAIQSRSAKTEYTQRFPVVAEALTAYPDMVLDGEIVVIDDQNIGGSFGRLARHSEGGGAVFIAFDLIEYKGQDLRARPFHSRRALMEEVVVETDIVQLSPLFEDVDALFAHVQEHGMEGIIAKPMDSTYREGKRGPWLKLKARCSQEFAVLGFDYGDGKHAGLLGAVTVGYWDDLAGGYIECGSVGTGFDDEERAAIRDKLLAVANPDAEQNVAMTDKHRRAFNREGGVWVDPVYVIQAEFQRWTDDGRLFHPAFLGFREDKEPNETRREPCAGDKGER